MKHIKEKMLAVLCMAGFIYLTQGFAQIDGLSIWDVVMAFILAWVFLPFCVIMMGIAIRTLIRSIKEVYEDEKISW